MKKEMQDHTLKDPKGSRLRVRAGSVKLPRSRSFCTIARDVRGEGVVRLNCPEAERFGSGVLSTDDDKAVPEVTDASSVLGMRAVFGVMNAVPSDDFVWNRA